MYKDREEFINQCIKNRRYLEYSVEDICNCLLGVSVKDYMDFERGKWNMNDENIMRLSRVLCISQPSKFNLTNYIDVNGLNEEEIKDLEMIVKAINGDKYD